MNTDYRLHAAGGLLAPVRPSQWREKGRERARPRKSGSVLSRWSVLPRLVAELRDALDTCAERQRQLERDLRVSRRLLRTWYADTGTTG